MGSGHQHFLSFVLLEHLGLNISGQLSCFVVIMCLFDCLGTKLISLRARSMSPINFYFFKTWNIIASQLMFIDWMNKKMHRPFWNGRPFLQSLLFPSILSFLTALGFRVLKGVFQVCDIYWQLYRRESPLLYSLLLTLTAPWMCLYAFQGGIMSC